MLSLEKKIALATTIVFGKMPTCTKMLEIVGLQGSVFLPQESQVECCKS